MTFRESRFGETGTQRRLQTIGEWMLAVAADWNLEREKSQVFVRIFASQITET